MAAFQGSQSAPGLQNAGTSPLMNIGLGLMSAAAPHLYTRGNVGEALANAQQATMQNRGAYQQQAMNQLQFQQAQAEAPMRMAWLKAAMQGIPGSPNPQGGTATPSGPTAPPGPMSAPAAPTASSAPPQSGGLLGGDPMDTLRMGTVGAMLGMPGASSIADFAKTQMQYDPRVQSQLALAKDPVSLDRMALTQAQTSGDKNAELQAYNKLQTDTGMQHVGSMSGIYTRVETGADGRYPRGSVTTINPSTGLVVNSETGASWLPGAAAAVNQRAAAEATGKAQGELTTVTGPDGAQYQVPASSMLPGGGRMGASGTAPARAPTAAPSMGAAPAGSPSAPMPHTLGPGTHEMLEGNAKAALETNKGFQDQAEGAQQMIAQVGELKAAATEFNPGQFADARAKFLNYLNSTGLITADQTKALGSFQAGQKIAIQLQAAATKQLGSREAAQVFQYMGKSLPNLTLSPDGLTKVSAWQTGIANYNIARAADANSKAQANDIKGVNLTRDTWIKNSNPLFYVMAQLPPPTQQEFLKSMGPQKGHEFIQQWTAALKGGFAPPLGGQ